jgi:hypothetical protein
MENSKEKPKHDFGEEWTEHEENTPEEQDDPAEDRSSPDNDEAAKDEGKNNNKAKPFAGKPRRAEDEDGTVEGWKKIK